MKDVYVTKEKELQLVVFAVNDNEYAISILSVREIINVPQIVALPNMPSSVVGVINLRGSVITVVDLGEEFGTNACEGEDSTRKILIVEMKDQMVGYLVDNVTEVLTVNKDCLEKPASSLDSTGMGLVDYICNLTDRLIPVVDLSKLLTSNESVKLHEILSQVR